MEVVHAVVRGGDVHGVPRPTGLPEVDMADQQAVAWQESVPAFALAILQEIVFRRAGIVDDTIGRPAFAQRRHLRDGLWAGERFGLLPAQVFALMDGIVGRAPAVVAVVAPVHQVPFVEHGILIACSGVEVGQSEDMGELMADGADAAGGAVAPEFLAACIVGYGGTVIAPIVERLHIRPDAPFAHFGGLIAAEAGIDDDHCRHPPVAFPVVVGKVDLLICRLDGTGDFGTAIAVGV